MEAICERLPSAPRDENKYVKEKKIKLPKVPKLFRAQEQNQRPSIWKQFATDSLLRQGDEKFLGVGAGIEFFKMYFYE